ncbi:hypothetical protein LWI28_012579 [Acer negundo]|uniref:Uncharacterized protein n=1 Tax=Acer negundo TaxID=4023 RepID=A0AAD5JB81_ACENE|nr:hypothetical protein LWI28_012579 [Acer negundo]KAK4853446.1 hypothetical protein QYF36_009371 [Acer negundo]
MTDTSHQHGIRDGALCSILVLHRNNLPDEAYKEWDGGFNLVDGDGEAKEGICCRWSVEDEAEKGIRNGVLTVIFSTAMMARARKGTSIMDDVDRRVEKAYAEKFLYRRADGATCSINGL